MRSILAVALAGTLAACSPGTISASPSPAAAGSPSAAAEVTPTPSATATPTASPSATPTPTGTATALPTPAFPAPSGDASAGIGPVASVRFSGYAADAARVAGTIGAGTDVPAQIEVVTVATGARTRVAHARLGAPQALALAGGTLVYYDIVTARDGSMTFGVWRIVLGDVTPAPVRLDDFPSAGGFGGGDTINPWPNPRTNGRDVVWLRARESAAGRTHELPLARGIGTPKIVYSGRQQPFYAIDDGGRIAIATSTDKEAVLSLWDPSTGATRELGRRPAERGGLVSWTNGRIAWFDSYFNVRPADRADLYEPLTGTAAPFSGPPGCGLLYPTTTRHIIVTCFSGRSSAHDLVTERIVPLAPVVIASEEALLMRSTAEFDAGTDAWLHAAVLRR